jgi:hypothetical protein
MQTINTASLSHEAIATLRQAFEELRRAVTVQKDTWLNERLLFFGEPLPELISLGLIERHETEPKLVRITKSGVHLLGQEWPAQSPHHTWTVSSTGDINAALAIVRASWTAYELDRKQVRSSSGWRDGKFFTDAKALEDAIQRNWMTSNMQFNGFAYSHRSIRRRKYRLTAEGAKQIGKSMRESEV